MSSQPSLSSVELSDLLVRAARLLKSYRQHLPSPVEGLESALIPLMVTIDGRPMRVGEMATKVCSDVSTVSRQVATLARLGLVEKTPDSDDRRAVVIELTPAGHDALRVIRGQRTESLARLVTGWSPDELDELRRSLQHLSHSVEAALAQPTHPA